MLIAQAMGAEATSECGRKHRFRGELRGTVVEQERSKRRGWTQDRPPGFVPEQLVCLQAFCYHINTHSKSTCEEKKLTVWEVSVHHWSHSLEPVVTPY